MSKKCNTYPETQILLVVVIISFLLVANVSLSSASEIVYSVNSYGRHSPTPHWSTVTMMRGSDLSIIKSVITGYDAHEAAADPDNSSLWVTNRGSSNIDVIDPISLKILKNISGSNIATPLGIVFTPDSKRVYVAMESIGKVAIFDAHTYEYISSIDVGGNPAFIVLTPDGSKVYVVDFQNAVVSAIKMEDNSVTANLQMRGHKLQKAVISPDGAYVYVSNMDKNQIEVIRTKDDTVLVPIPTTSIYPSGISISHDGIYLFTGLQMGVEAVLNMVRLADNKVVSSISFPGNAMSIAIRHDGSRIFVSDHDNDKCYAFNVNGENLSLAATANLGGEPRARPAPIGLVVIENPVSSENLVSSQPTLSNVSNAQSSGVTGRHSAGSFSFFIAITALLLLSRCFWHRG